jgi:hypothetical protein
MTFLAQIYAISNFDLCHFPYFCLPLLFVTIRTRILPTKNNDHSGPVSVDAGVCTAADPTQHGWVFDPSSGHVLTWPPQTPGALCIDANTTTLGTAHCDATIASQVFAHDKAGKTLKLNSTGLCVDVTDSTGPGVQLRECNGGPNQQFDFNSDGTLTDNDSPKNCLGINSGSLPTAALCVTFFDLPKTTLYVTTCDASTNTCRPARIVDQHATAGDFTDFGAGGFPGARVFANCVCVGVFVCYCIGILASAFYVCEFGIPASACLYVLVPELCVFARSRRLPTSRLPSRSFDWQSSSPVLRREERECWMSSCNGVRRHSMRCVRRV